MKRSEDITERFFFWIRFNKDYKFNEFKFASFTLR